MSNKVGLIKNILLYGLGIIGVLLCVMLFTGPSNDGSSTVAEMESFREGWKMSLATSFTGFLMFACIGLIVIFFVVQLISNPKKTINSIIGILIAGVLYFVLSLIGSSDNQESLQLANPVSASTVSGTTAGLYTVIIGLVVAVLAIVLGPLMGRMRK